MTAKPIVLNPKIFKFLSKRLGERFKCKKDGCHFAFQIGDTVISKTVRRGRTVLYHEKCYEELFI